MRELLQLATCHPLRASSLLRILAQPSGELRRICHDLRNVSEKSVFSVCSVLTEQSENGNLESLFSLARIGIYESTDRKRTGLS
jgi:hypothetical protein